MNKKIGVTILLFGILFVIAGGIYLYVNNYTNKMQEQETNNSGNENEGNGLIDSCSDCKFMYLPNTEIWTLWNSNGETPTKITSNLSDSYLEITKSSGKRYFLGVKLNEKNEITNIYGCGVQDEIPFCIEATSDGSKYESNVNILKNKVWNEFFKTEKGTEDNIEYEVTYCPLSIEILGVQTFSEGTVKLGDDNYNFCMIRSNGYAYCTEIKDEDSN